MASVKPEFPRPQLRRDKWLNLNGDWDFALFPAGSEAEEADFARDRRYDKTIVVPFTWTCPLSGIGQNVAGTGWYRAKVYFPARERVFLCFGAVDYECRVYVNGETVAGHEGGYTYFEIDVTDFWREGENTIEVRANDERRENQLYGKQGYGEIQGIWQTVWLEERPLNYIKSFRFTTLIDGNISVNAEVAAPDGAVLKARFDGGEFEGAVSNGRADISFKLENPRLWSPDDPYLYEGELALENDTVHTYFGVREIGYARFDGRDYPWITLNGEPIYINGTLDQSFNPEGYFTYPSEDAIYNEVFSVKRLGLNMARLHIKAEEPRKLYWMDKLGVLAMADIPCFWGPPDEIARAGYERDWPRLIERDVNHPCVFAWIMFNESWGLLNKDGDKKVYLPETQRWVESVYKRAKDFDPTRLVEDNSACLYDHTETDLNTWHFYINGYEAVRDHIREVADKTFPGSSFNHIGSYVQRSSPLMNSECGMVWGVENSAGDSDLAWQYHYMLNEFRLHDKICGFVFTELNDVVNEFNGYYRIDGEDKDFGYGGYCRGMTLRDLHAGDFIATDCPPCQSVKSAERVKVPLTLSGFSASKPDKYVLHWELWHDAPSGRATDSMGDIDIAHAHRGATPLGELEITMPCENALEVLSLYLTDGRGNTLSRNFVTFDVEGAPQKNAVEIPVSDGHAEGFKPVWQAMKGEKLCLGGSGEVSFDVALPQGTAPVDMEILVEAGSKRVIKKDLKEIGEAEQEHGFMRGYLVDRGAFANSYWMTDQSRYPSEAEVLINGVTIATINPQNDWADARGALSWFAQKDDRHLDEAGSYGELFSVPIPGMMLPAIARDGGFKLTFKVSKGGLALYGRGSGRYATGLTVKWAER